MCIGTNCLPESLPETTTMGFETSWKLSQIRQKSKDDITRKSNGKGKEDGNPERFGKDPESTS